MNSDVPEKLKIIQSKSLENICKEILLYSSNSFVPLKTIINNIFCVRWDPMGALKDGYKRI